MRRTKQLRLFVLMFIVSGCAHVTAAQSPVATKPAPLPPMRADTTALRHTLDSIADAHHGVVGYSVIDLDNDVRLNRRGDETFPTASLIKVAILVTVYDLAWLMITISDNTTTNLLLDRIIIRRVWDKMEALGLPHTKVHSKSFR